MSGFQTFRARIRGARSVVDNLLGKDFEPEISALPTLLRQGAVCMHIGASDGRHSYAMVRQAGAAKVYAFEPSSYSFTALEAAMTLHGLRGKVARYRLAIGDRDGETILTTPRKTNGHMGRAFAFIGARDAKRSDLAWTGDKEQETVVVTSVDNFVQRNHIERIDFIRVDCEGAEGLVLKGAAQTIGKQLPSMLIEIHPVQLADLFGSSAQAVLDTLYGWGYRTFVMASGGRWQEVRAPFASENAWKDYACLHSERHAAQIEALTRPH